MLPRIHPGNKGNVITSKTETVCGLDVDLLMKRVEGLFAKLLTGVVSKSIMMAREKLVSEESEACCGSAVDTFLLKKVLMGKTAHLRLERFHTENDVKEKSSSNMQLSRASTLKNLLTSTPSAAARSAGTEGLTKCFLDIFAQTIWLHGLRFESKAIQESIANKENTWLQSLGHWGESSLFDSPASAIQKAPPMPNIHSLHLIRKTLSWSTVDYDKSVLNRAIRENV